MGRRAVRIGALTGHPYAAVNLQCEEELATFKKIPEASEMYQMVHAMEIRSCDDLNLKKKRLLSSMLTTSKRWQSVRQGHKVNCLLAPVLQTVVSHMTITYEIYDT